MKKTTQYSAQYAISVTNLELRFKENVLLSKASLKLNHQEKVFLYGESGCGKSSLLKLLVGGIRDFGGSIICDGKELIADNLNNIRQKIAYIPQHHYFALKNVKDELLYPFKFKVNHKQQPSYSELVEMLEFLNLSESILDNDIDLLSGGERQRIVIARALLLKRPLILADEPTSALDSDNKKRVVQALAKSNSAVLAVTHDLGLQLDGVRKMKVENRKVVSYE